VEKHANGMGVIAVFRCMMQCGLLKGIDSFRRSLLFPSSGLRQMVWVKNAHMERKKK
jgi:hypothetical protein